MKWPVFQLAFFTLMIGADVGNAIYSYYYTYDKHSVCNKIILALKNCNLFAQLLIKFFNC
jgi:hypothetical protein